jgi:hypothetical protein
VVKVSALAEGADLGVTGVAAIVLLPILAACRSNRKMMLNVASGSLELLHIVSKISFSDSLLVPVVASVGKPIAKAAIKGGILRNQPLSAALVGRGYVYGKFEQLNLL